MEPFCWCSRGAAGVANGEGSSKKNFASSHLKVEPQLLLQRKIIWLWRCGGQSDRCKGTFLVDLVSKDYWRKDKMPMWFPEQENPPSYYKPLWTLIRLQTHGSVTEMGPPGLQLEVSPVPEVTWPHQFSGLHYFNVRLFLGWTPTKNATFSVPSVVVITPQNQLTLPCLNKMKPSIKRGQ